MIKECSEMLLHNTQKIWRGWESQWECASTWYLRHARLGSVYSSNSCSWKCLLQVSHTHTCVFSSCLDHGLHHAFGSSLCCDGKVMLSSLCQNFTSMGQRQLCRFKRLSWFNISDQSKSSACKVQHTHSKSQWWHPDEVSFWTHSGPSAWLKADETDIRYVRSLCKLSLRFWQGCQNVPGYHAPVMQGSWA